MKKNKLHIAPCGIICNICLGFQREKNTCVGCTNSGNKPPHCEVCGFKTCNEKKDNPLTYCDECSKFPCRRMKNLEKRYVKKYGESPINNLQSLRKLGFETFNKQEIEKWTCSQCGKLVCVHRSHCLNCGNVNHYFPTE